MTTWKPRTIICKVCGEESPDRHHSAKYCSDECYKQAQIDNMKLRRVVNFSTPWKDFEQYKKQCAATERLHD